MRRKNEWMPHNVGFKESFQQSLHFVIPMPKTWTGSKRTLTLIATCSCNYLSTTWHTNWGETNGMKWSFSTNFFHKTVLIHFPQTRVRLIQGRRLLFAWRRSAAYSIHAFELDCVEYRWSLYEISFYFTIRTINHGDVPIFNTEVLACGRISQPNRCKLDIRNWILHIMWCGVKSDDEFFPWYALAH